MCRAIKTNRTKKDRNGQTKKNKTKKKGGQSSSESSCLNGMRIGFKLAIRRTYKYVKYRTVATRATSMSYSERSVFQLIPFEDSFFVYYPSPEPLLFFACLLSLLFLYYYFESQACIFMHSPVYTQFGINTEQAYKT